MKFRANLNGQNYLEMAHESFCKIEDHRALSEIPLSDFLMSALAIFKLKMSTLLELDKHRKMDKVRAQNIKKVFKVKERIPSDTHLRDVIDQIPYYLLRDPFKKIFNLLHREKVLAQFKYSIPGIQDSLLTSMDGTGHFHSTKVNCEHCLIKKAKNKDEEDEIQFHHQMLGAAIVNPNKKTVIPFAPEPIFNDGGHFDKNDCENKAAKRMLWWIKDEHPGLPFVILGDALYGNRPMLKEIKKKGWHCILGIKPGTQKILFEQLNDQKGVQVITHSDEIGEKVKKKRVRTYKYLNGAYFSEDSIARINILDFTETIEWENKKGHQKNQTHFTWMTTIDIEKDNIYQIMKAGRSRWKQENEVFNTLKNQGYNFEHNYGHGKKYLSTNLAIIMHLAFLMDQLEETFCEVFQKARESNRTKLNLWSSMQYCFDFVFCNSWQQFLLVLTAKNAGIKAEFYLDNTG
ncbi:MAG: hypothetical protein COW78_02710 [Bdellovibrio sp. CG22_combo_CG10-13_8_21_14_all_39_27]|nr:MAG: hypothetical protein COW78_02710 [Bdellovibrio sp. CG22_combo_CG10-13_8_21_14_all_39_27]